MAAPTSVSTWANDQGATKRGPPIPTDAEALCIFSRANIIQKKQIKNKIQNKMNTTAPQWAKAYQAAQTYKDLYGIVQGQRMAETLAHVCFTADLRILCGMIYLILKMEETLESNPKFIQS